MNTIHKIIIISILFFGVFSNINAQKNNGIAYVDLGLPSGNLWATNNIGSSGSYVGKLFTWGDTKSSSNNYWYNNSGSSFNYKYGNQSLTITKYCSNPALGYQGYSDNLSVLQPEDDAATAIWGEGWRIPTYEDWMELISNCTIELVIKGNGWDDKWVVTAKNGNSISLPFSKEGYWSSSLNPEVPHSAWCFKLDYDGSGMYYCLRSRGRQIRPVRSGKPNVLYDLDGKIPKPSKSYTVETVPNTRLRRNTIHVSDPDGFLSFNAKRNINTTLSAIRDKADVFVVVLASIDNNPDEFATRLANYWGLGDAGKNNGVLLLFVDSKHSVVIRTGKGMGRLLPDSSCQSIISQTMIPYFKEGDYEAGICAGVREIAVTIQKNAKQ